MLPGALRVPIVQAPLAGGASTPALTAAVVDAGAFGFVAAGYKSAYALRDDISATRALTGAPFGVNVFVPGRPTARGRYERYIEALRDEAGRQGVALGEPHFEDDGVGREAHAARGRPGGRRLLHLRLPARGRRRAPAGRRQQRLGHGDRRRRGAAAPPPPAPTS